MAHATYMDHLQSLLDMKRTSLQSIAELQELAIGASTEELSIIQRMIRVEQGNVKFADIAISCHQIATNAPARVA